MPSNFSSGLIPLDQVPEFERVIAGKQRLVPGNLNGAAAHVQDDTHIAIDNPAQVNGGVLAHELIHQIQGKDGNMVNTQAAMSSKSAWDSIYGLSDLAQHHNINSLSNEQQAEIPRQYMEQYATAAKAGDAAKADALNKLYARPVQQLRSMATSGMPTTPEPPGAPPAALTGMMVPLPGMDSASTHAAPVSPIQHMAIAAKTFLPLVKKPTR